MPQRNLAEVLRWQAERRGPSTALRYKRLGLYHDLTWGAYREAALACAAALVAAGVQPGDRVGLLSENRVEWLLADMGILTAGAVNVPPHAPLTTPQIHYQLHDAGVVWLFVSTATQLDKILTVAPNLPALRGIVIFDRHPLTPSPPHPLIQSFTGFLQHGRLALAQFRTELERREALLGPEDLATIMYTSGTTGNPKGVMLTQHNLLCNAAAVLEMCPSKPGDVFLNWLPFSHIYARTVDHYRTLLGGLPLCLAESHETVVTNLGEIHPTHMNSVPRFYEKVLSTVASPDPSVTASRLHDIFGPRIDFLSSGGAPLPVPVAEAYRAAGLLLLQGYGLTETSPVITFNGKEAYKLPTVGRAIPGVEVRIADDGEILTRGPHVMKGYWNNPTATAETIRDGWLYTGDLGALDADGFLSITGRKKEILVLSNGKKVVPAYLEGLLIADPCIDQAIVCGEGRNYLVALLSPNWSNLREVLAADGIALDGDDAALARHPAVRRKLQCLADTALREVASWERMKRIAVLPEPLSVANDELTVTLKMRRKVVLTHHTALLESLYRDEPPGVEEA